MASTASHGWQDAARRALPARGVAAMIAVLAALAAGCASAPPAPLPYSPPEDVDFSGSWEIDYSRSDNADRALRSMLLRLTGGGSVGGRVDPSYNARAAPSRASIESVVALARLADEITRAQVLEITQTPYQLEVDRGDSNFALTCALLEDRAFYEEGALATELCGWDGDRFVFRAVLPDGLTINHRLTLAPDGQQLHIASTLSAPSAASAFTLNRFYRRFEPLAGEENCRETLTRGRICERRGD